jgi:hypothetical protein
MPLLITTLHTPFNHQSDEVSSITTLRTPFNTRRSDRVEVSSSGHSKPIPSSGIILKQVYYNHFGCFNLTKVPLHRELFFRVSWRRGGSGGKARGGWVGRGRADGIERHGKAPRLKLMRFHPSFSLRRFCFLSLHV